MKSSAEIEYNSAYNEGTYLAHFRMSIQELLNKDPYIVPDEAPLIILDGNYDVCMDKNGTDTNHIRHIASRVHYVRNDEN